jgi:hypothetical protein
MAALFEKETFAMNIQFQPHPTVANAGPRFEIVARLVLQGGGALGSDQAGGNIALAEVPGLFIGAINSVIAGNELVAKRRCKRCQRHSEHQVKDYPYFQLCVGKQWRAHYSDARLTSREQAALRRHHDKEDVSTFDFRRRRAAIAVKTHAARKTVA